MNALYSCLEITPEFDLAEVRLFDYARGGLLPGSQIAASQLHTNVPRGGFAGLPMSWQFQVDYWRAQTNAPFRPEPVLQWAADTVVELIYSNRVVSTSPLLDLLLAPQPLSDSSEDFDRSRRRRLESGDIPIPLRPLVFRENLSFEARVILQQASTRYLKHWIVENTMQLSDPDRASTPKWTPAFRCWLYLEGVLQHGPY